jgi:hypothetical protein
MTASHRSLHLVPLLAALSGCGVVAAEEHDHDSASLLVVSRVKYEGNTFGNPATFPQIFNDPSVSGVQGSIHIDFCVAAHGLPRLRSVPLSGITSSFSSKSEGAVMLSVNKHILTYMGYAGPVGSQGVSNSETTDPGSQLTTNTAATYDRMVALIGLDGVVTLNREKNAFSGDNPRAAITVDGSQLYMAGNSDSSLNKDKSGPGTTMGTRYGLVGQDTSVQLGAYIAADRPDETAKQHIKDSNVRAIGIFNGNLYVAKGSGGNGDDGLFQVHNGTGDGLPTGTGNQLTALWSAPATDPVTGAASPYTPFGFWFANATTLYVADEGYANVDTAGNLIADPMAGLQKWRFSAGAWHLEYILTEGLDLYQAKTVAGYPVPTSTYGLRNLIGQVDGDGSVTLYAVTSQYSTVSGGEPDPTSIVRIRDCLEATTLPTGWHHERFHTLATSKSGEVFRGVALVPLPHDRDGDDHGDHDDRGPFGDG